MYDVSVVACKTYEPSTVRSAMEQAISPFGGLDWVQEGMKILIKPNLYISDVHKGYRNRSGYIKYHNVCKGQEDNPP